MVHGERVGLCVEHPVFQGEHVVFREQKIEIPVSSGEGARQPVSGRGIYWEQSSERGGGASGTGLRPRGREVADPKSVQRAHP